MAKRKQDIIDTSDGVERPLSRSRFELYIKHILRNLFLELGRVIECTNIKSRFFTSHIILLVRKKAKERL